MIEGFTESYIKIIFFAKQESHRIGHNFVCTEQILLGMLCEEASLAAKVLESKGVNLEQVRVEVEKLIGCGAGSLIHDNYPFTSKAERAIDLAGEEAERLEHNYLNTGHLLLGILRIEDGIALQLLTTLGVDATELHDLIVQRLSENTQE